MTPALAMACATSEGHDMALARFWGDLVRPDDIVWALGDISIGGRSTRILRSAGLHI
ncbi:hypothetical protein [Nocardia sp. NPDC046763]|uniref:hypothetical protein n=1 Tax=Nocardia sp. NPDC046763 TaxID=3155256 RepID=UPI0034010421